ncbi:MAG: hydrogenase maturation protease [Bacteroidota bacterium]|jgi:hydrogenase maturation protease
MAQSEILNPQSSILIIGIGNIFRGDDGVGILTARNIQRRNLSGVQTIEESGEGTSLIDAWKDRDTVIIIDAVSSGTKPGTIHSFDAAVQQVPSKFFNYSTHAFSLAEAIELARVLNRLPGKLFVYGIEGKNFHAGSALSPEVEKAGNEVLTRILREHLTPA